MSSGIARTGPQHPYRKRTSTWWWLGRFSYFFFVMREISSVFVAWTIIYLLMLVRAVSHGDEKYQQFVAWGTHPIVLLIQVVTLCFLLIHTITWFNLVPQVMVVNIGGRKLPPVIVAGSNYVAWVVVTVVAAWVVLRG